MIRRAVYYSAQDGTVFSALNRLNDVFQSYSSSHDYDINDLLEFNQFNIFFKENIIPTNWCEEQKRKFNNINNEMKQRVVAFFSNLSDENFLETITSVELRLKLSLWDVLSKYNFYTKLSADTFLKAVTAQGIFYRKVLEFQNIVKYFSESLRYLFLDRITDSAEILLYKFVQSKDDNVRELFMPPSLSSKDVLDIINQYILSERVNANYLKLIIHSGPNGIFRLEDKTILSAKKKLQRIESDFFSENSGIRVGVQVQLALDSEIPVLKENEEGILKITYGAKFLDRIIDNTQLLRLFRTHFNFFDKLHCFESVKRSNQNDILSQLMISSETAYNPGIYFRRVTYRMIGTVTLFRKYLESRNVTLEFLMENFVNKYLVETFNISNISLVCPTESATYEEKVKILLPRLERILKQYKMFVEDNFVDNDLLEISTKSFRFSDYPSKCENKYFYLNPEKLQNTVDVLFSETSCFFNQSLFDQGLKNLYEYLDNRDLLYDDFSEYQKVMIDDLRNKKMLYVNAENKVKIKNKPFLILLYLIYNYEVLHYPFLHDLLKPTLQISYHLEYFTHKKNLFSSAEQDFLDFILNNSKFTDGLALRNKYMHGSNNEDEAIIRMDYELLVSVFIMVLLKIEDDLISSQPKL